jgi:SAM-dependent methyltransferase
MTTFRFGKNWQAFVKRYMNEHRIQLAITSIKNFLGTEDLSGKTFIDVGAGSGLDSLAAVRMGCSDVLSFDIDDDCMNCCTRLKEHEGNPGNWRIEQGSIVDDQYVSTLGQFDIVYSWGVLHHTGQMWKAIENTLELVKPGGVLFLAIYNKADGFALYPDGRFGPSWLWKIEKKIYVSLPFVLQEIMDYLVMAVLFVGYLFMLKNPFKVIADHKYYFNKGMSWRINIKDWLGGYPYEYATVEEIFAFAKERGFSLENLTCNNGLLNNEFLFRHVGM